MVRIIRTISQQQVLVFEGIVVRVVVSEFLLFLSVEIGVLNTYNDLMPVGFLMDVFVIICSIMKIDALLHRLVSKDNIATEVFPTLVRELVTFGRELPFMGC